MSAPEPEIALSNQWVADIVQEYAYQFQGFCQYRTQLGLRTPEELQLLEANRDIWVLPVVLKTLQDLYISGKQMNNQPEPHYVLSFFSCFASVELARVECLVGDYSTSLQSLSPAILGSRIDLISQIPTCHVNVYYHAGVAQLMLKRHIEALDTFSDVILAFISSIKATPGHRGGNTPLVKTLDKILFLLTVTYALSPGYRINEQVKELVESKLGEKYRKLISGDVSLMSEMFEGACPKFVCSVVPNYSVIENLNQEAFSNQATLFTKDAGQLLSILKIRSYLRVYKSIELSKVARMTGVSEEEITSQLQSLKQRTMQYSSSTDGTASTRVSISDVQFSLVDNVLMIEEDTRNSKNESAERFFKSSTRKHIDIMNDMNRIFRQYGL